MDAKKTYGEWQEENAAMMKAISSI